MVGVNEPSKSCVLHPCSACKRRRIGIPSLPKDIIFKILLCLPADIIYNVMKYVCREWYNIIKDPIFTDAHIQKSPACFLVQMCLYRYSPLCVEIGKRGIEVTDLSMSPKGLNWFWSSRQFLQHVEIKGIDEIQPRYKNLEFPGMVLASCRGLVLVSDLRFQNCLHVANLLSKQWVKLPPFGAYPEPIIRAGLAYAASCKTYKVAYTYYSGRYCCCEILSVGVDKGWRYIFSSKDIPCIRRKVDKLDLSVLGVYSAGRYIHWEFCTYVLSLDVETESFHVSVIPREFPRKYKRTYILAMESYLYFMATHREYIWELWALTKVETGEWTELLKIDLTAEKPVLELRFGPCGHTLVPVGLLKNGEIVMFKFFRVPENLLVCNVKTGEIVFHQLDQKKEAALVSCSHHVKSLVPLECAW